MERPVLAHPALQHPEADGASGGPSFEEPTALLGRLGRAEAAGVALRPKIGVVRSGLMPVVAR